MAVLGLRFCARAFSSCGKRGPLLIAVRGPLTIAASLVAEHRLQTRRLSNCGSRAQPLRGMWDLPRPGLEPASPTTAGRLSTTAPPGKPSAFFSDWQLVVVSLSQRHPVSLREASSSTQFPLDPELPWKPPHYGSLWSVVSKLTYGCLFKHYIHIPLDCILHMF